MVIIPLLPLLIIALVIIFGIAGNFGTIGNNICVISSIIIVVLNCFFGFLIALSEEGKGIIAKTRKIFLCVFSFVNPIIVVILFLVSNVYITEDSFAGFEFIYQEVKVYLISAIVGCVINIVLLLVSSFLNMLEPTKKVKSKCIDALFIVLMISLPIIGKNSAYYSSLQSCKSHIVKTCEYIVKKDDEIFTAFRIGYEKEIDVNDTSIIELKFINRKLEKGEILFGTGREFDRDDIEYLEVYNDHVYGYIEKNSVKVRGKTK